MRKTYYTKCVVQAEAKRKREEYCEKALIERKVAGKPDEQSDRRRIEGVLGDCF